MGFSIYSNTLESHVINLRGQDNLKTKKMREIVIGIYSCKIELKYQEGCMYIRFDYYSNFEVNTLKNPSLLT